MSKRFNSRKPYYNSDADYTTNAPSYYEDLARKNKLIQLLSEKIWAYEKTLETSLENIENVLGDYIDIVDGKISLIDHKIGEGFNDEIEILLVQWVEDGTLEHIINHNIFNDLNDQIQLKAQIILSNTEPLQSDDETFWYEDKGTPPINFNTGDGLVIANATTSDEEPRNDHLIWFEI